MDVNKKTDPRIDFSQLEDSFKVNTENTSTALVATKAKSTVVRHRIGSSSFGSWHGDLSLDSSLQSFDSNQRLLEKVQFHRCSIPGSISQWYQVQSECRVSSNVNEDSAHSRRSKATERETTFLLHSSSSDSSGSRSSTRTMGVAWRVHSRDRCCYVLRISCSIANFGHRIPREPRRLSNEIQQNPPHHWLPSIECIDQTTGTFPSLHWRFPQLRKPCLVCSSLFIDWFVRVPTLVMHLAFDWIFSINCTIFDPARVKLFSVFFSTMPRTISNSSMNSNPMLADDIQ